nr:ornithine decarboxylase-like [Lytechinus pictus]
MGLNISAGRTLQEEGSLDARNDDKIVKYMKDVINGDNVHVSREDDEDPFFVLDLKDVEKKHHLWKQEFPNVQPFYAVKCNSNRRVLEMLAILGAGFDCASKAELQQVLDSGVQPNRIIYAHPCKANHTSCSPKENDVRLMTFDNEDELVKIKEVFQKRG